MITPALKKLWKRLDVAEYGGALLLGVKAPFFICHGNSKAKDIRSAIGMAVKCVQSGVVEKITELVLETEQAEAAGKAGRKPEPAAQI